NFHVSVAPLTSVVRQERHVTGVLDRAGERTLVLGAGAGAAARQDLATLTDELHEQCHGLVVDGQLGINRESAYLALSEPMRFELCQDASSSCAPSPCNPAPGSAGRCRCNGGGTAGPAAVRSC